MASNKTVMMIAGEASSDHYAGALAAALKQRDVSIEIIGMGGEEMRQSGVEILQDIKGLDVMGFWDVLTRLRMFKRIFRNMVSVLEQRKPEAVILVDYPGFNIRFAKEAHKRGIRVIYFISPKVWAWNRKRRDVIAANCDKMLVFFEFEIDVYRETGLDTVCVGHPLAEELEPYRSSKSRSKGQLGVPEDSLVIGLLPGSRKREIQRILPPMLDAAALLAQKHEHIAFVCGCAPTFDEKMLRSYLNNRHPEVKFIKGMTHDIMAASDACMVTSGTATLEAGIIGTPHVLCYKVGLMLYMIASCLVKIPDIGIVNIASGKRVMPELVQYDMTPARITEEIERFLNDEAYAQNCKENLDNLYHQLKNDNVYEKAADEIFGMING